MMALSKNRPRAQISQRPSPGTKQVSLRKRGDTGAGAMCINPCRRAGNQPAFRQPCQIPISVSLVVPAVPISVCPSTGANALRQEAAYLMTSRYRSAPAAWPCWAPRVLVVAARPSWAKWAKPWPVRSTSSAPPPAGNSIKCGRTGRSTSSATAPGRPLACRRCPPWALPWQILTSRCFPSLLA